MSKSENSTKQKSSRSESLSLSEDKSNKIRVIKPVKKSRKKPNDKIKAFQSTTNNGNSKSNNNVPTIITFPATYPARNEISDLRRLVEDAIKQHRTFLIFGYFDIVKNALVQRGWVEKLWVQSPSTDSRTKLLQQLYNCSIPELMKNMANRELCQLSKEILCSKFIGLNPVGLYWNLNVNCYKRNPEKYQNTYINIIPKTCKWNYANKTGLCGTIDQAQWFNNPGVSCLRIPRTYNLSDPDDYDDFITDFRITAVISLLKWIVKIYIENTFHLISKEGKIPISTAHFALLEAKKILQRWKHEDIDKDIPNATDTDWNTFLCNFHKIIHYEHHFDDLSIENDYSLYKKSKTIMDQLKEIHPNISMDGFMNIWIIKPSQGARGIGIKFCKTLESVEKMLKMGNSYVIQKYIEKPLLIHQTKFDIRQWFLISSTQPLSIWMWKKCYLRFSSQTYNLKNMHEVIHLTNNSVQIKYKSDRHHPQLPEYSMWSLDQFKRHLAINGQPNVYDEIIYPGMKECIIAAILANQDQMEKHPKAFELYGADFMVTEDYLPWLIEINSKPAMNPSTPVTSEYCPKVLEDVIKVVIDHSKNQSALTGDFELLYRELNAKLPIIPYKSMEVRGMSLIPGLLLPKANKIVGRMSDSIDKCAHSDYVEYVRAEMRRTLSILDKAAKEFY